MRIDLNQTLTCYLMGHLTEGWWQLQKSGPCFNEKRLILILNCWLKFYHVLGQSHWCLQIFFTKTIGCIDLQYTGSWIAWSIFYKYIKVSTVTFAWGFGFDCLIKSPLNLYGRENRYGLQGLSDDLSLQVPLMMINIFYSLWQTSINYNPCLKYQHAHPCLSASCQPINLPPPYILIVLCSQIQKVGPYPDH